MRTISADYDIASPPDRVFAALTDLQHVKNWRTLESVRLEPDGPAHVGTRIHTTVKGPGQAMRFVNEVTELDPVRRRYDDRWTTRYEPRGIFRLFGPLLGRIIRQGQEKDMAVFAAQLVAG